MSTALGSGSRGRGSQGSTLWVLLLLATTVLSSRAAPTAVEVAAAVQSSSTSTTFGSTTTELESNVPKGNTKPPPTTSGTTKTPLVGNATTDREPPTKAESDDHLMQPPQAVVQLLDLEHTEAPPMNSGHDGLKLTRKKQLQQQHFPTPPAAAAAAAATTSPTVETSSTTRTTITTTTATTAIESEMERIPIPTSSSPGTTKPLLPVHNGYLGPIFMGEKTFAVVHPLKKPQPPNHLHVASIESQLRNGRLVEILAPTSLLEQQTESTTATATATPDSASMLPSISVLSSTVFQVPEPLTSTTRLPLSSGPEPVSGPAPPRTESKISDIQIEVYDSTVDSIVASTNFRDNEGYYPPPVESGTTRPPRPPVGPPQERFTQYVIDRADVSTQPASSGSLLGKPEPAAIEIHINVSEAFGSESEDLEFSYRQPQLKPSKPSDEILVVEIIDNGNGNGNGDNSSTESSSSGEHINPIFTFRSDAVANPPPAVRPPQLQDADELFMADLKEGEGVPRPPPPPPPPPPRKPSIDRDSDTIFYISNTEVKVGESLPTGTPASDQQQRKFQLENQFFPASYVMDQQQQQQQQQRSSLATPRYEEDIILSPVHNTADALKIFRSTGPSSGDGAPPLDVTYVGESVIEVEQQPQSAGSTQAPLSHSPQSDIVIQPAVLPDLAIGVPVIGELPPQIELKEIDYMPGELGGMGIYENDIQSNSIGIGVDSDPDVIESSIQYGGDLIDDGAGGGFDGVEGSYPFDSPAHRQLQDGQDHLPRHSPASHLHREQLPMAELLNATLLQHNENGSVGGGGGGGGGESGSVSAMAPLLSSGVGNPQALGNATALSDDTLDDFESYLNLFAVSMGLIIVVLPSGLLISMYCAIRYMLNKNARKGLCGAHSDDSEQGTDSKNEDISRNARETKMHTDKDGVFVVEVARGIDSKQTADMPGSALETTELPFDTKLQQANGLHILDAQSLPPSHEQVQIHAPPSDFSNPILPPVNPTSGVLHLIEEAEEQLLEEAARPQQEDLALVDLAQTGLSQSDLSSTSSTDSNKRYSYGNQELYVIEQSGYATSSPTAQPILPTIKPKEQLEEEKTGEQTAKAEEQAPDSEQQTDTKPEPEPEPEPQLELKAEAKPEEEQQAEPEPEPEPQPESVTEMEPDNTYDSLMSLPAPPSTEEIKELNDFSLLESNQLDSLPPPPPPPLAEAEPEKKEPGKAIISPGHGNGNGMSKVSPGVAEEPPATLTPPASPPASPPQTPQSPTTIYGSSNGLPNGHHALAAVVDVNGS
ncbi:uncharacterized protein LOC117900389 [Drosophila subobscura]|uniref:uncharacterized protein LOC117900389 n=1 Tax=Drosophila subobscura TaxID=7241 RepID=UPI00155B318C|nr:uncharacterized protein LOC117900389 [Drosophila subobscura]